MAEELEDGFFWLPSEILTEDELLTAPKGGVSHGFGNYFSFSPFESVNGTESDENDAVLWLTRNMQKTSLQSPVSKSDYTGKKNRGWKVYGSVPQSTQSGWDLLCVAAAEEVARVRTLHETASFNHPTPEIGCPTITAFHAYKSQSQARLAYLQPQAFKFQRMRQHEQHQIQMMTMRKGYGNLQFRAPPFAANGLKKERIGTGVFLPRRFESPNPSTATRNKQGCFPVQPEKRVPGAEPDPFLNKLQDDDDDGVQ